MDSIQNLFTVHIRNLLTNLLLFWHLLENLGLMLWLLSGPPGLPVGFFAPVFGFMYY